MNTLPLTAYSHFAAEISGLDLQLAGHGCSSSTGSDLRRLLHERLVLVFRDQSLSCDDLMAIAELFGSLGEKDPWILAHRSHNYPDPRYPHIRTVSAEFTDPASGYWHADRLYRPMAPDFLILYGLSTAPDAAPTEILSMRAIWNKMSQHEKDLCKKTRMSHTSRPRGDIIVDARYEVDASAESVFCRPLVHTDPYTGQVALCVTDYHDNAIVGMTREEGVTLVNSIYAHVEPDDYLSHSWSDGDLVILDNRSTNHRRGVGANTTRTLRRLQGYYHPVVQVGEGAHVA